MYVRWNQVLNFTNLFCLGQDSDICQGVECKGGSTSGTSEVVCKPPLLLETKLRCVFRVQPGASAQLRCVSVKTRFAAVTNYTTAFRCCFVLMNNTLQCNELLENHFCFQNTSSTN